MLFFYKTDDLEIAIYDFIEPLLSPPLLEDDNIMAPGDIEDVMLGFPALYSIVVFPGHFNHIAFPFHMPRYCTAIHNDDPVLEYFLESFNLTAKEQNDARLQEQIWFLMFIGTDLQETQKIRNQFREQKARIIASFLATISQNLRYAQPSIHTPTIVDFREIPFRWTNKL